MHDLNMKIEEIDNISFFELQHIYDEPQKEKMNKQLSLFEDTDRMGMEYVHIIGSIFSCPVWCHIRPTLCENLFILRKRLDDGYPMELMATKVDENTYRVVNEK